jgi:hypothetical protein
MQLFTRWVTFPATQVPSSDPNTLDDYEENTFTPAITFATPGDLAVTYSSRVCGYTKKGQEVTADISIITSAFTHTTAAGDLQITGLPFTPKNTVNRFWGGALTQFGGITKAGYTQFGIRVDANTTTALLLAGGSGVAAARVQAADMPTGGSVVIVGTITYVAVD